MQTNQNLNFPKISI